MSFNPFKWFKRDTPPDEPDTPASEDFAAQDFDPTTAEKIAEIMDPYTRETTFAVDGQHQMNLSKVFSNVSDHMERLELNPELGLTAADAITEDEANLIAGQNLWECVLIHTAQTARNILTDRWPKEAIAGPIPDDLFLARLIEAPGTEIDPRDDQRAKEILNRALAGSGDLETLPELEGTGEQDKLRTWVPLMCWYWVKCSALKETYQ